MEIPIIAAWGEVMSQHRICVRGIQLSLMLAGVLTAGTGRRAEAQAPDERPRVAILVFDDVQVIDFSVPFEVFTRFNIDRVFLVSKDGAPITTWRGLHVTPDYSFADSPVPDVLVVPGGDTGPSRRDPDVIAWIRSTSSKAQHVLSICTGASLLAEAGLLDGLPATTFFERQDALQQAVPSAQIVRDRLVVDAGKIVTAAGTGLEGALYVMGKLHGPAWQHMIALHMEAAVGDDPLPATTRSQLADLNIPSVLFDSIPWREATFLDYAGDLVSWHMAWRYQPVEPLSQTVTHIKAGLASDANWQLLSDENPGDEWHARWSFTGQDGLPWLGVVDITSGEGWGELATRIWRAP
jgi:putative intracellular protease/amidase